MAESEEERRIRAVYRGYADDAETQERWGESPGNRLILAEREGAVRDLLQAPDLRPLCESRVLEIGCGVGKNLQMLARMGVPATELYGIDLMEERVLGARRLLPEAHIQVGNGGALPFPDGYFDLVLLFTVLSSILDDNLAQRVASEAARVLSARGGVLWYDMRIRNPRNPNVRGIERKVLASLFPGFSLRELRSLTVLPPVARLIGGRMPGLYPALARVPLLRSHYLGLLRRPTARG
jgi:SAM-dependent methyltransferase